MTLPTLFAILACHGGVGRQDPVPERPRSDVLIAGGTLAIQGHPTAAADVLLRRTANRLLVAWIGETGRAEAVDTVDAGGLFIHSGNAFQPAAVTRVGEFAMYVIRQGASQGDPAVWVVTPDSFYAIPPSHNQPPGPIDGWVGCYTVERGPWDDPADAAALARFPIPEDLRLHWQYLLRYGPSRELAATTLDGSLPDGAHIATWRRLPGDSLFVGFSDGFLSAVFHVGAAGTGFEGMVTRAGDTVPGPRARAHVRLQRRPCLLE